MAGVLFLILAWLSGTFLLHKTVGPFSFLSVPERALRLAGLWSAGLWVGLLPATLLTYVLAAISAALFSHTYPLLFGNSLVFAEWFVLLGFLLVHRGKKVALKPAWNARWRQVVSIRAWPAGTLPVLVLTLVSLLFAGFLMWDSFAIRQGQLAAGYSIFGDFAAHTALVRSFAVGWNWPTGYPHFAGDGIHYHFLFYFLCGNLHYLGLPIDWAINLPSILAFVSVVHLLALLARAVTGRFLAAILAPVLFFFRSSLALPLEWIRTWQADVASQADPSVGARLGRVACSLWEMDHFVGTTPHDDWGLWTLNVYINQRHFLSGLAVLLVLVLLLVPDLKKPASRWRAPVLGFQRDPGRIWADIHTALKAMHARQIVAILLWLCLPFWHGSVLVASLLILAVWWLFLQRRLVWTVAGCLALASALLQIRWFSGSGSGRSAVSPQWLFGFIAADASWPGIFVYLLLVTGFALPLALISALDLGRLSRLMLAASGVLLVFLFSVSLTVDVTANHKYLMLALVFVSLILAGGLARLFAQPAWTTRLLAGCLILSLTCTGLYETRLVFNINRNHLDMPIHSPLVAWIMEHTPPRAIFLTAPYHYHAFFYSGRQTYYGHAYYAWSAGHDTAYRDSLVHDMLASTEEDWPAMLTIIQEQGIDYLLVDDDLRFHPDFDLNEDFFRAHFATVAAFPDQGHAVIYDIHTGRDRQ